MICAVGRICDWSCGFGPAFVQVRLQVRRPRDGRDALSAYPQGSVVCAASSATVYLSNPKHLCQHQPNTPISQPPNTPISQPTNQPTNQPPNHLTSQPPNLPTNQPTNLSFRPRRKRVWRRCCRRSSEAQKPRRSRPSPRRPTRSSPPWPVSALLCLAAVLLLISSYYLYLLQSARTNTSSASISRTISPKEQPVVTRAFTRFLDRCQSPRTMLLRSTTPKYS